jgi:hypothetical protein
MLLRARRMCWCGADILRRCELMMCSFLLLPPSLARAQAHPFLWGQLDMLAESCPSNASASAKYGMAPSEGGVCYDWGNATRGIFATRGAACASPAAAAAAEAAAVAAAVAAAALPPLNNSTNSSSSSSGGGNVTAEAEAAALDAALGLSELGEERGAYSTLTACAVHAARGARSSAAASSLAADAPFLLFVAGDVPPLPQLLRRHAVLGAHADSAAGALGHVSAGVVCGSTRHSARAKVCSAAGGWDPGGAWTRAMVDAWMLGSVDVLVRLGGTSFMNVVRARVAWPLPQIELVGELMPLRNWTLLGRHMMVVHSVMDVLQRELLAEEQAEEEEAAREAAAAGGAALRR